MSTVHPIILGTLLPKQSRTLKNNLAIFSRFNYFSFSSFSPFNMAASNNDNSSSDSSLVEFSMPSSSSSEVSTPTTGSITSDNVDVYFPPALVTGKRTPQQEERRIQRWVMYQFRVMVHRDGLRPSRAEREAIERRRQREVRRWLQQQEAAEVKAIEEGMRRPPVLRARELGDNICHDLSIHASGWNNHRRGRAPFFGIPPPRQPPCAGELAYGARAGYNRNSIPRWRILRANGTDADQQEQQGQPQQEEQDGITPPAVPQPALSSVLRRPHPHLQSVQGGRGQPAPPAVVPQRPRHLRLRRRFREQEQQQPEQREEDEEEEREEGGAAKRRRQD